VRRVCSCASQTTNALIDLEVHSTSPSCATWWKISLEFILQLSKVLYQPFGPSANDDDDESSNLGSTVKSYAEYERCHVQQPRHSCHRRQPLRLSLCAIRFCADAASCPVTHCVIVTAEFCHDVVPSHRL
jgi:hypothetical protein